MSAVSTTSCLQLKISNSIWWTLSSVKRIGRMWWAVKRWDIWRCLCSGLGLGNQPTDCRGLGLDFRLLRLVNELFVIYHGLDVLWPQGSAFYIISNTCVTSLLRMCVCVAISWLLINKVINSNVKYRQVSKSIKKGEKFNNWNVLEIWIQNLTVALF